MSHSLIRTAILQPLDSLTTVDAVTIKVFYPNQSNDTDVPQDGIYIFTAFTINTASVYSLGADVKRRNGSLFLRVRADLNTGTSAIDTVIDHLSDLYDGRSDTTNGIFFDVGSTAVFPRIGFYEKELAIPFFQIRAN